MRIAVWHDLPSGGALRLLGDQLRGLAARGHELHVWSPPPATRRFASTDGIAASHEVPLAVPASPRGLAGLRSAWRGHLPDLDALAVHSAHCAREMRAINPDVVFAYAGPSFRPPAIAPYAEVPTACYLNEPNRRLGEATFEVPWVAKPPHRRAPGPASIRRFAAEMIAVELSRVELRTEIEWVGAFDEVLVNSAFTRESVLRTYGRLARVSSPGIDVERFQFQERPPTTRGSVLTVGALVIEKNPVFLVRAVGAARPRVRRFVWVANHVDEACCSEVERVATELGIELELRRAISDDELLRSYAEADVFAYAPRLEPFGLAPLEANATGLPVVAVAEAGLRETIVAGVNGVIVDHDVRAFGEAISDILADPVRARAMGRAARDHVAANWSLDASVEHLEENLIAASSGGLVP